MLALLALLATGASHPAERPELTLDVSVYVTTDISPQVLEGALVEAHEIFAHGDIQMNFELATPGVTPVGPTVSVILQSRPARFVVHGCSRNRHDHRLGRTSFEARRITLWSEQVARAIYGDWDRRGSSNVSDTVLARALGRVLAHELGHFLLRLNGHRDDGLMRASFSQSSLTSKRNRAFRFSTEDLDTMRASIERHTEKNIPLPASASQ